jgi:hypothetical protein
VRLVFLDEQEDARLERDLVALDRGAAPAVDDEQPLIAVVSIRGSALLVAGLDHHDRRL